MVFNKCLKEKLEKCEENVKISCCKQIQAVKGGREGEGNMKPHPPLSE
jgi:hypothetical protein